MSSAVTSPSTIKIVTRTVAIGEYTMPRKEAVLSTNPSDVLRTPKRSSDRNQGNERSTLTNPRLTRKKRMTASEITIEICTIVSR
jgi:hypothetical protein